MECKCKNEMVLEYSNYNDHLTENLIFNTFYCEECGRLFHEDLSTGCGFDRSYWVVPRILKKYYELSKNEI